MVGVMKDRARLSKLESYTKDDGASFLGSKDFPKALIESINTTDPKGILFSTSEIPPSLTKSEQQRIGSILDSKIKGKSILVCSGAVDKLVPYHCSEPFLTFLKSAVEDWYKDGDVMIDDRVYEGVGHKFSDDMLDDAVRFIGDVVARSPPFSKSSSKI